jgi:hypothetical protein
VEASSSGVVVVGSGRVVACGSRGGLGPMGVEFESRRSKEFLLLIVLSLDTSLVQINFWFLTVTATQPSMDPPPRQSSLESAVNLC